MLVGVWRGEIGARVQRLVQNAADNTPGSSSWPTASEILPVGRKYHIKGHRDHTVQSIDTATCIIPVQV